jgi:hypothetical protein
MTATFGFLVFQETDKLPEFGYFVESDRCGHWSFGQFYKLLKCSKFIQRQLGELAFGVRFLVCVR